MEEQWKTEAEAKRGQFEEEVRKEVGDAAEQALVEEMVSAMVQDDVERLRSEYERKMRMSKMYQRARQKADSPSVSKPAPRGTSAVLPRRRIPAKHP